MTEDEYDELLRRFVAVSEKQESTLAGVSTTLASLNTKSQRADLTLIALDETTEAIRELCTSMDGTLKQMKQQLDRTDATHAGISRTLARCATTQEEQTMVLRALQTTLERWVERFGDGQGPGR